MSFTVCAIITVYYPDKSVLLNIAELVKQVSLIIITDNTPNVDNYELFKLNDRIIYRANKANLGLSKAFNSCLKLDMVKQSDFVLFMDQDSLVSDALVGTLINDYLILLKNGINVACVGPVYYEENANKIAIPRIKQRLLPGIFRVDTIITSSMLTTYAALASINFWNEDIFLDLADWDLCFRFAKYGFCCCLSKNVVLRHKLGIAAKRFCGFVIKCAVPVRTYYQIRDGLKLLSKTYTPMRYKIRFLLNIFLRPIVHIIFWRQKSERIKYLFLGVYDYICNRSSING
jgi:rhamnosyltransferase